MLGALGAHPHALLLALPRRTPAKLVAVLRQHQPAHVGPALRGERRLGYLRALLHALLPLKLPRLSPTSLALRAPLVLCVLRHGHRLLDGAAARKTV